MSQSTLDQLRDLAEAGKSKKKAVDERFFKPEYGTTYVRFLPGPDGKLFVKKFGEHWLDNAEGRKTRFVCRRVTLSTKDKTEKCPICDAGFDLYATKNEADRPLARKFMPSEQYFINVVVRGEDGAEDVGPKVWKFGKKLFEKIKDEMLDEKVDLSDPETGMDFKIVKKKVQSGDQTFPNYDTSKINTRGGVTEIDEDDLDGYLENMVDIHDEIDSAILSFKELKKAFLNLSTDDEDGDVTEDVTETEAPKASKAKTEDFDEDAFREKIKSVVNE
jgi:hypothetical protein